MNEDPQKQRSIVPVVMAPEIVQAETFSVETIAVLTEQEQMISQKVAVTFIERYQSAESHEGMKSSIKQLARIVGLEAKLIAWWKLRYSHVSVIYQRFVREGYAPASIQRHLAALRGLLKTSFRLNLISNEDYARAIDMPVVVGSREPAGRMLKPKEIEALFAAAETLPEPRRSRDRAILAVALGMGLRRAEIARLDVESYDVENAEMQFIGKRNKERTVAVSEDVTTKLKPWLELRGPTPGPLFVPLSRSGTPTLRRLSGEGIAVVLQALGKKAGVKHFSPHDLRRTVISNLFDVGADIASIQAIVGHENPKTTTRYDRRGNAKMHKAVNLLKLPGGEDK